MATLAHIKRLEIAPPAQLRDALPGPHGIETVAGLPRRSLIPVVYAGSESHSDDRVKLGRSLSGRISGTILLFPQGCACFWSTARIAGCSSPKVIKFGETREE
jgi:protein involved in temperature-dependent protein secretion